MRHLLITLLLCSIASTAVAAPKGSDLYRVYCSACHGNDGAGGVGVPLSLPGFIDRASDQYLFKTIRHGRPDRVMPGFEELSDAQTSAIVSYMRSWSTKPAPVYGSSVINGNATNGKKVYQQNCQSCHGKDARGGKGTGVTFSRSPELPIVAPALNNQGFLHSITDEMIKDTVSKGRKGTTMLAYSAKLGETTINDVVAYIRSFENKTANYVNREALMPTLVYESSVGMKETLAAVKNAIIGTNFKVIRVQEFEQGYVKEGEEDSKKVIIYFCSFSMLDRALKIDPRAGIFLPCRITLIEENNKVKMVSINPAAMSYLFNNDELKLMCNELSDLYNAIMEEASL